MPKLHMFEYETEMNMPEDIKKEYLKKGKRGALCGYMRKTTLEAEKVTCFYCQKIMIRAYDR